jgi:hypothetical protein
MVRERAGSGRRDRGNSIERWMVQSLSSRVELHTPAKRRWLPATHIAMCTDLAALFISICYSSVVVSSLSSRIMRYVDHVQTAEDGSRHMSWSIFTFETRKRQKIWARRLLIFK